MSLDETRISFLCKRRHFSIVVVCVLTNLFAIALTTGIVIGVYEGKLRREQRSSQEQRQAQASTSCCKCNIAPTSPTPTTASMNVFDNLQLLYQQNFEWNSRLSDFEFSDPAVWKIQTTTTTINNNKKVNNTALQLMGLSAYEPRVRSPFNIAFLKVHQFDDFILELDIQQTSREYNHRDFCLFFGMKDATNFYYVHMGSKPDSTSHNIFLVNDEDRRPIGNNTAVLSPSGVNWGTPFGGDWKKVRLHRQSKSGEIYVYFNDQLILQALDTHFPSGYLGFGSFDDTGIVDNIRVWGSDTVSARYGFFV